MIGFSEVQKEREDKISRLKSDLNSYKIKSDDLELQLGTLSINHEKVLEQQSNMKEEYDDVVEKLHLTNNARHDLETKVNDEIDRNRRLQEVVRLKEETLNKRNGEIEDLDKKVIDWQRSCETLEVKKQGVERQFETAKKQLNDKITNLNEVINSEKDQRDMWIERYEKEQKDHTMTNSQLLQARSDLKDQMLAFRNGEIKLNTANRQI